MAPIAIPTEPEAAQALDLAALKAALAAVDTTKVDLTVPPDTAILRLTKAGIDLTKGYPNVPARPDIGEVQHIREYVREGPYNDPGSRADKSKAALFGAATKVVDLTKHFGTEIIGLQLKDLTDQQKDELALLVSERGVVFFRDQDLTPQKQLELGVYWGDGIVEEHPLTPTVPGHPGVAVIWPDGWKGKWYKERSYRRPYPAFFGWHTDFVHEAFPASYTHLHQDSVPEVGGDTLWASGYAAYDKLSPAFRTILEGLKGIYKSGNSYPDPNDPHGPPKYITRTHPLVRTHPVTGWKVLYVNRGNMLGIEGFDKAESDALLTYLNDLYERSLDIQLRWHWTPGTSAIWDNRATIHSVSFDYDEIRHGTRVASLAEKPYFDPASKSRAEALDIKGFLKTENVEAVFA
ncbi:hypothetical protein Q8F55_002723 [Vanrija albida]|uniref:TauD/TfdA-like domain-containing protein n=1 Tax=Vanrija albida TaxID=181172 RepID=A0ABR3QAP2_9TREE